MANLKDDELYDYWADGLPCRAVVLEAGLCSVVLATSNNHAIQEEALLDDSWAEPRRPATRGQKQCSDEPLGEVQVACRRARLCNDYETLCEKARQEDLSVPCESGEWEISSTDYADILRWIECARVGRPVADTRIVPCKTPFEGPMADAASREELFGQEERFERQDLLERCRLQGTPVGLVIDLVNTSKYYEGFREDDGVEYQKLPIRGHAVPPQWLLEEGFGWIDDFLARRPSEYVVVHCTHGVNRTGFFIAAYLLMRGHVSYAADAIGAFQEARGEKIDKGNLIRALHRLEVRGWY